MPQAQRDYREFTGGRREAAGSGLTSKERSVGATTSATGFDGRRRSRGGQITVVSVAESDGVLVPESLSLSLSLSLSKPERSQTAFGRRLMRPTTAPTPGLSPTPSEPSTAHGCHSLAAPLWAAAGPGQSCARLPSLADGAQGAAGGRSRSAVRSSHKHGAARRCSASPSSPRTPPAPSDLLPAAHLAPTELTPSGGSFPAAPTPSRAAVTGATSCAPARSDPERPSASGLTADPAHNPSPSAGPGAARPADIPAAVAVDAPSFVTPTGTTSNAGATAVNAHITHASGTTTHLSSLARIATPLLTVNTPPKSAQRLRLTAAAPTSTPQAGQLQSADHLRPVTPTRFGAPA